MALAALLYAFAAGLTVFVIIRVIRSRKFSVSDTLATIGVLLSLISAISTGNTGITIPFEAGSTGKAQTPTNLPTTTPHATSTFVPTPTTVSAGSELYAISDWSDSMKGWSGSAQWKTVNGMLLSDGSISTPLLPEAIVLTPYKGDQTADYAIETEIQAVKCNYGLRGRCGFGMIARYNDKAENRSADSGNGYIAGVDYIAESNNDSFAGIANIRTDKIETCYKCTYNIKEQSYTPGGEWHTYRLEVKGNTIRLLIDGDQLLAVNDNRFLSGVPALYSFHMQINVRNFKVIAL